MNNHDLSVVTKPPNTEHNVLGTLGTQLTADGTGFDDENITNNVILLENDQHIINCILTVATSTQVITSF